jgi:hypothetical protein
VVYRLVVLFADERCLADIHPAMFTISTVTTSGPRRGLFPDFAEEWPLPVARRGGGRSRDCVRNAPRSLVRAREKQHPLMARVARLQHHEEP